VYLLHFERPHSGRMQHYIGFTRDDLDQRLENHRQGGASATTKAAVNQEIRFTLARTWSGTPKLKREIKDRGPVNYCPACRLAAVWSACRNRSSC
jgi:predicted GIY-YIG superfamily endonuclease